MPSDVMSLITKSECHDIFIIDFVNTCKCQTYGLYNHEPLLIIRRKRLKVFFSMLAVKSLFSDWLKPRSYSVY